MVHFELCPRSQLETFQHLLIEGGLLTDYIQLIKKQFEFANCEWSDV